MEIKFQGMLEWPSLRVVCLACESGCGRARGECFRDYCGTEGWTVWGGIGGQKEGELPGAARVYALCILQDAWVR